MISRKLSAIILCSCFLTTPLLCAQTWWFDVDEALQSVDEQQRLLIIVQFHNDFLLSPRDSRELKLFAQSALDDRNREWLDEHAVLVAHNVGPSEGLRVLPPGVSEEDFQQQTKRSGEPDPGQCVVWYCDLEQRVLFCQSGYPDAAEFNRRARWAHQATERFLNEPRPFKSAYHGRQIHALDRVLFHEILDKVRIEDEKEGNRNSDLTQAIEALARVRDRRLRERFGASIGDGNVEQFNAFLSQHAAFESDLIHNLLAYEPLPPRREMERDWWQRICRLRMWAADQQELVAWAEYQTRRQRPLMLRVIDEYTIDDRWPPDSPVRLGQLLDEFAEREVSLDDVAVIAAHHDFADILLPSDVRPMFLAATSRGDSWKLHTHRDKLADLTRTLARIESLQRQRNRRRR